MFAGGSSAWCTSLGPTGGYLLAFPVAAGLVGGLAADARPASSGCCWPARSAMVVIHAGGVAQLALLGGDPAAAFRVGFVPFFTGDLLKVGLAAARDPGPPARRVRRRH